MIAPFVYEKLAELFFHELEISDTSIYLRKPLVLAEDKLRDFYLFLENVPLFIKPHFAGTLVSTSSAASTLFKPKTKRPSDNSAKNAMEETVEDKAPNIRVIPAPVKDKSTWPSGKTYDPNKPSTEQDVKPFISSSLPKNKFFATSLLTENDYAKSSNPYLVERFKEQVEYPALATLHGTQGYVLNLFGRLYDSKGNPFNINGKIKIKGNQVGDVRAYFEYEVNEDNQVLCVIKNVKFKAHKKR